jgi:hypothetical protein
MALPENFDSWQHLLAQIKRLHNPRVKKWFKSEDNREPEIVTGPASLKEACTITGMDSAIIALLRMWLFDINIGAAAKWQPAYYGYPIQLFQERNEVIYHPQVHLFFSQDKASTPDDYRPLEAEISFRLMDETYLTMTELKATRLATEIKRVMGTKENPYRWNKGKTKFTYLDNENGYDLRILAQSEVEAVNLCKKIVSIRGHRFEEDFFREHIPHKSSINVPGLETIYGESRRKRRWRPTGTVKFRWASMSVYGMDKGLLLYDPFDRINDYPLAR